MVGGVYAALAMGLVQNGPVELSLEPMPLPQILDRLSRFSSVPLKAATPLRFEFGMLVVDRRPLPEVKEKIAVAFDAEWVSKEDGEYLTRGDALLKSHEAAYFKKLESDARQMQTRLRKQLEAQGEFDDRRAQMVAMQIDALRQSSRGSPIGINWEAQKLAVQNSPAGRQLVRMVVGLNPEVLARVPPIGVLTLSSHPNRLQVQLPFAESLLTTYNLERSRLMSKLPRADLDSLVTLSDSLSFLFYARGKGSEKASRAILEVRIPSQASWYTFDLTLSSAEGIVLDRSHLTLDQNLPPAFSPIGDVEAAIEWSPRAVRFREQTARFQRLQATFDQYDPDFQQLILSPDRRSIAELAAKDALSAMISQSAPCLVARITDFFAGWSLYRLALTKATAKDVETQLRTENYGAKLRTTNGWNIVGASNPHQERRTSLDNGKVAEFLKRASTAGSFSIFEYADLAFPASASHFETYLFGGTLLTVSGAGRSFGSGEQLIKLIGALSVDLRQRMLSGASLSFAQLPLDVQRILTQLVSGSQANDFYRNDERPVPDSLSLRQVVPTEALPNGIPASARLTMQRTSKEIVECSNLSGGSYTEEPLLHFAARLLRRKTNSDEPNRPFDLFRALIGSSVTIRFDVETGLHYSGTMIESQRVSPWVDRPEKLPSDVWQRVEGLVRDLEQGKIKPPARSGIG